MTRLSRKGDVCGQGHQTRNAVFRRSRGCIPLWFLRVWHGGYRVARVSSLAFEIWVICAQYEPVVIKDWCVNHSTHAKLTAPSR